MRDRKYQAYLEEKLNEKYIHLIEDDLISSNKNLNLLYSMA